MVIQIKGFDIKLGFGLYFLGKAQKKNDTDLKGLLNLLIKNPIADMVDLIYYSAQCEAELDEVKLPINKRDLVEFLEETKDFDNVDGVLTKFNKEIIKTITGSFLPKDDEKGEDEKGNVKKK